MLIYQSAVRPKNVNIVLTLLTLPYAINVPQSVGAQVFRARDISGSALRTWAQGQLQVQIFKWCNDTSQFVDIVKFFC